MESAWKRSSDEIGVKSADVGSGEYHEFNVKDESADKSKEFPSAEAAERRLSGEPALDSYAPNFFSRDGSAELVGTIPKGGSIEAAQKAGSAESEEKRASRESLEKPKPAKGKAKKATKAKKTETYSAEKGKKSKLKLKGAKSRSTGGKGIFTDEDGKQSSHID